MDQALDYEVIYSGRKTLAVTVTADGRVVVRAPERFPKSEIRRFIEDKQDWIRHHMKLSAERKRNVVVHELAHLKVMNHSPAFYEAVAQYMPDYEQPKTWLSKHGAEYNIHLIS